MHQGNSIKQSGSAFQSGDIQNFVFVALMTCIFSTMDNAVTVYHANGTVDIGQWPRILLALSGLMAGFLFDIAGRKYMSVIMYCVMLLSTTCLVIIQFAGPFTVGLVIFYLSAGFFAVFFTSSFMEIARYTDTPELWSGFGRSVNNLVAAANITKSILSSHRCGRIFFAVFSGKTDNFASILRMAEFRHPIFGRLADFPYIKIGTL